MWMAMVVAFLVMSVLDELGRVGVFVTTMIERDRDLESVWLGNLLKRFPIGPSVRETEHLPRAVRANRFQSDEIHIRSGHAKTWRHAVLKDRDQQQAMASFKSLLLRPVNRIAGIMSMPAP